jgi:hypothetical protein
MEGVDYTAFEQGGEFVTIEQKMNDYLMSLEIPIFNKEETRNHLIHLVMLKREAEMKLNKIEREIESLKFKLQKNG